MEICNQLRLGKLKLYLNWSISSQGCIINETTFNLGQQSITRGKTRDVYDFSNWLLVFCTDRGSAFDGIYGTFPCNGFVRYMLEKYGYAILEENNIPCAKTYWHSTIQCKYTEKCTILPLEFIVRGFNAGSLLKALNNNELHEFCGIDLDELRKKKLHPFQKFKNPFLTPTTKVTIGHDQPISPSEIVARGIMTKDQWEQAERIALKAFKVASKHFEERGIYLVDTKFEFGINSVGEIVLIDEVFTPDSSRFWPIKKYIADGFRTGRFTEGAVPQALDKDPIRRELEKLGYDGSNSTLPKLTNDQLVDFALLYIESFERLTGEKFPIPDRLYTMPEMEYEIKKFLSECLTCA